MALPVLAIFIATCTPNPMLAGLQHVVTVDMTLAILLVFILFTTDCLFGFSWWYM